MLLLSSHVEDGIEGNLEVSLSARDEVGEGEARTRTRCCRHRRMWRVKVSECYGRSLAPNITDLVVSFFSFLSYLLS